MSEPGSLQNRMEHRLDRLQSLDLLRELSVVESPMGPEIQRDGQTYVNFSSNDYLGLASDSRTEESVRKAVEEEGVGSGGSRLICGDRDRFHDLESELADWKQRDHAMLFGSGYLASLGTLRAVTTGRDLILLDELSHRSLIEGARLSEAQLDWFDHNLVEDLETKLSEHRKDYEAVLVVTEAIFSMDGDRAPVTKLREVCNRFDAWLFVDEAHSGGIWGPEGAGLTREMERPPELTMGTCSKALGSYGGFVVGDQPLKRFLVNRATTAIYSTALPPAIVASIQQSVKICRNQPESREQLKQHLGRVEKFLRERNLPCPDPASQIFPIITGKPDQTLRAASLLREANLDAVPIRYPTVPRNRGRIRVSLRADHTEDHIGRLLEGLKTLEQEGLLIHEV